MTGILDKFQYTKSKGEFYYKGVLWNAYTNIDILNKIERLEYRNSDIFVCTFPRSGTTLTQEIIWQIKHKTSIEKNGVYGDIDLRFPFLEFDDDIHGCPPDRLADMPAGETRLIKTHCPLNFIKPQLSKVSPIIFLVMRNPKDVCVSLYHFYKGMELFGPWTGQWSEFVEMFLRGYTKDGSWLEWHLDWWNEVGRKWGESVTENNWRVFTMTYEELIKRPRYYILKIAEVMKESLTDAQLEIILHNCKFETMSKNSGTNFQDAGTGFNFIRKGQIGNWKEYFDQSQNDQFDEQIISKLAQVGLHFQYEV